MPEINNKELIIGHVARKGGTHSMPKKHYHEGPEIYYLLEGERYYFIENRTYRVKKGDIVLIDKNILHRTIDADNPDHQRILIEFNDSFLKPLSQGINDIDLYSCFKREHILSINIEKQIWLENHLFKMIKEKKGKDKGYTSYIKILLLELLVFLNRQTELDISSPAEHPDQTYEKISEIASYINNNYNQDLTLKSIAKNFNYSPTYLSKTFKQVTGFNFVEYKNNVRVKEARRLLQQTKLNVSKIAGKVGYNNLTHFGRVFKEITNYSPLKYRKLYNKK